MHVVSVFRSPAGTHDPSTSAVTLDGIDPMDRAFDRLRAHVQMRLKTFLADIAASGRKVSGHVVSHVRTDDFGVGIAQLAWR